MTTTTTVTTKIVQITNINPSPSHTCHHRRQSQPKQPPPKMVTNPAICSHHTTAMTTISITTTSPPTFQSLTKQKTFVVATTTISCYSRCYRSRPDLVVYRHIAATAGHHQISSFTARLLPNSTPKTFATGLSTCNGAARPSADLLRKCAYFTTTNSL
ncbi:Hypothetical predicted protein [Olea europaea subsp. europaea]|uniref:Uncharacterized protein n=1 Tax=Olea europaea subsp. europaea TaxID=158383 RepID=A0A8S0S4E6_OLEEU|nr:Hypothetical predicted protein [Olea europaea subsp. europaea]